MSRDMPHRFAIGQTVYLSTTALRPAASGTYEIVRLLPVELGVPQYRVKSKSETHERLVRETELSRERQ